MRWEPQDGLLKENTKDQSRENLNQVISMRDEINKQINETSFYRKEMLKVEQDQSTLYKTAWCLLHKSQQQPMPVDVSTEISVVR